MADRLSKWLEKSWTVENLLFCFLLLASTLPIWCLSEVPTQDGPAHLYNAYLLSGWWKTSFPVDRTFFAFNPAPVPNWFSTAVLATLMQVCSPRLAEKLLLTSYVILLPLAFRYAARSFDHVSRFTYFLGFALVWNHLFELGFFNFCFSLVWYLVFLGYWARRRRQLSPPQIAALLICSCVLYFSNGLSYYLAAATLGLLSVAAFATEPSRVPGGAWLKATVLPQLGLFLAVPFSIWYFAAHSKYDATRAAHMTLGTLTWSLSRASILVSSYNAVDLKLSAAFGLVLLIATVATCYDLALKNRGLLFSDVLLIAAACQFILYAVVPRHALGGGFINYRILLFALATLALWVAIQPYNKQMLVFISGAAMVIGLGLTARNLQRGLWLSAALDEYKKTADHLEEHKSLLPLYFDYSGYGSVRDPGLQYDPFMHAAAFLAIERGLVDLDDYEATSRNFPIVYRQGFDPMRVVLAEGPSAHPPLADIAQYQSITGRAVDYVLLWDAQRWNHEDPLVRDALQQVSSGYVLTYCAENIPLRLYRLREETSSAEMAPNCPPATAGY